MAACLSPTPRCPARTGQGLATAAASRRRRGRRSRPPPASSRRRLSAAVRRARGTGCSPLRGVRRRRRLAAARGTRRRGLRRRRRTGTTTLDAVTRPTCTPTEPTDDAVYTTALSELHCLIASSVSVLLVSPPGCFSRQTYAMLLLLSLWSPYVIGQAIIFSSCFIIFFFFFLA